MTAFILAILGTVVCALGVILGLSFPKIYKHDDGTAHQFAVIIGIIIMLLFLGAWIVLFLIFIGVKILMQYTGIALFP